MTRRSDRLQYLDNLEREVGLKEQRCLRGKAEREDSVWFGLGMFGLVGWSVVVPTVLGIFLGVWIDRNYPSSYSFVLMGLAGGLVLGCFTAWRWVRDESNRN